MSCPADSLDARLPQSDFASAKDFAWWFRGSFAAAIGIVALAGAGRWVDESASPLLSHHGVVKGNLAHLAARLDGHVTQLLVEENQKVSKGELLACLEDQQIQSRLERAQTELERLQKQFALEQLAIEAERARQTALGEQIHDSNRGAQAPIAAGEVESNSNTARLAAETLRLRESGLESLKHQIATSEDSIAAANAELELTQIRAPEDGWINRRLVEAGGSVRAGDPIVSLWVGERVWIEAWVAQSRLADFQVGEDVNVRFIAYAGQLAGRVERVEALSEGALADPRIAVNCDPIFGEVTQQYCLRISIPYDDMRVVPGLTALVSRGPAPMPAGQSPSAAESPAEQQEDDLMSDPADEVAKR